MNSLLLYLTKKWPATGVRYSMKRGRSSSAPQVLAFFVIFDDERQSFFLKHSSFYSPGSSANRKIKQRAGTHDEVHRHEELPQPFPVLAVQLIAVPDSAYRETSAFSPLDNIWRRTSILFANAVH